MLIPGQLTLLLERLFGTKQKGCEIKLLPLKERVEVYIEALDYVERDIKLFAYVLGHRRLVTVHECKKIDEILLECICRDPRIIPKDFRERLPKKACIVQFMERLYMRDKEYKKLDPKPVECQESAKYQCAAE